MPLSPPPPPNAGKKRKRHLHSSNPPSSEPQPKRERPAPSSNAQQSVRTPEQKSEDIEGDLVTTIHPPLPVQITRLQKTKQGPVVHDLTVISSSKIQRKVGQVLGLLRGGALEASSTAEAGEHGSYVGDGAKVTGTGVLVRVSAKSGVASKAITIVEIVKRELRAGGAGVRDQEGGVKGEAEGDGHAVSSLWQYNQVHGVRLAPRSESARKKDRVGVGVEKDGVGDADAEDVEVTRIVESGDGDGDGDGDVEVAEAGDVSVPAASEMMNDEPVPITTSASSGTKGTRAETAKAPATSLKAKILDRKRTYVDADGYLVTRDINAADGSDVEDDQDMDMANPSNENQDANSGGQDEEDTSLVTLPASNSLTSGAGPSQKAKPSTNADSADVQDEQDDTEGFTDLQHPADRAKERERLSLIASLRDDNEAKRQRAAERPTPVLTIYLATKRIKGWDEEVGEEKVI